MTSGLSAELIVTKDPGTGDYASPSFVLDCYSCKCLRRSDRAFPMGCTRASTDSNRRGTQRPQTAFWRPWIHISSRLESTRNLPYATGLCENPQYRQKLTEYNHPVRLFWPKSKPLDNMYVEAADLLQNFPVQATLSFYNDSESDTDNEGSNSEEEHDSGFESD